MISAADWKRVAVALFTILAFGLAAGLIVSNAGRHRRPSPAVFPDICRENLHAIAKAKQAWAVDQGKAAQDTPTGDDLFRTFKYSQSVGMPVCPERGTYTIGAVSETPRCSIPGHTI